MRVVIEIDPKENPGVVPVVGEEATFYDSHGNEWVGVNILEVGTVAAAGSDFAAASNQIVDGATFMLGLTDGDVDTVLDTVRDLIRVAANERLQKARKDAKDDDDGDEHLEVLR